MLILGVDGGGSKTEAWLADAHEPSQALGIGRAGPANLVTHGPAETLEVVHAACRQAFRQAQREPLEVAAACLALAGAGSATARVRFAELARSQCLARVLEVVHDGQAVLDTGQAGAPGLVVIAGTGSLVFARDREGREYRAGGHGPLLGDPGSAFAVGLAALRAATGADEGLAPPTEIGRALRTALSIEDLRELTRRWRLQESVVPEIAALAPLVETTARAGDVVAQEILQQSALQLFAMLRVVHRALKNSANGCPLYLAGSFLARGTLLREELSERISTEGLAFSSVHVVNEPVRGCLRRAARAVHEHPAAPGQESTQE